MKYFLIQQNKKTNAGFALLFTVLLVSISLSIAVGISNVVYKQTILSSLAKDSQLAFYQADTGAECGLYYDFSLPGVFAKGMTVQGVRDAGFDELPCGNNILDLVAPPVSSTDYFVYQFHNGDSLQDPCYSIIFDKRDATEVVIQSYGYNICNDTHPRQVERALEVRY